MTWRVYVVPTETTGRLKKAKYFGSGIFVAPSTELIGTVPSFLYYGTIPWCLVACDTTTAQHNFLAAQADVSAIPTVWENSVAGSLNTVKAFLNSARLPSDWVQSSTTWRTILRGVTGIMWFAQRYKALNNSQELIPAGVSLTLTMNSLSQARRDAIQATADSFTEERAKLGLQPYDLSSITGSTTIEDALLILGQQFLDQPFKLGDLVV